MEIMKSGIDIEMREKLSKMAEEMEFEFERHVIPFWKIMRDKDCGGYYGKLEQDLKLDRSAEKGCVLNSRILWAFSNLYLFSKKQEYRIDALMMAALFLSLCPLENVLAEGAAAPETQGTENAAPTESRRYPRRISRTRESFPSAQRGKR